MKCITSKCLADAHADLVICERHDDEIKNEAAELDAGFCPLCKKTGQKTAVKVNSHTPIGYAFRCPKHGSSAIRVNHRIDSYTKGQLVQMERTKATEVVETKSSKKG